MVPLLVAFATSLTALAGSVHWCRILRRALIRERAAARLSGGAMARDIQALEQHLTQAAAERAVLAAAAAIVDAAVVQQQTGSEHDNDNWKGGGDA